MRTGGLPPGIATLLGKLGINVGQAQPGKGDAKVAKQGLQGAPKEGTGLGGLVKGAALADGALLAGLGHTPEDRRTGQRNNAEQSNIDRFMQDPHTGLEGRELPEQMKAGDAERLRDAREHNESRDMRETKEARETREELRREDRADDARLQAHQDQKSKEKEEQQEARERERERERQKDEREPDEDEKPGGAWLQEELEREEEEKKRRSGIRDEDTLGSVSRCRGRVEDGTQCLRKPVQGTPYCREHAFHK